MQGAALRGAEFVQHRCSDLADHIFQLSLVYGGPIQITPRWPRLRVAKVGQAAFKVRYLRKLQRSDIDGLSALFCGG